MAFSHQKIDLASLVITEFPGGDINCSNVDFTTSVPFVANSLEVFLGGRRLTGGLDYTVGVDLQSFKLIIDPDDHKRLNEPPDGSEDLVVSFLQSC